MLVEINLLTEKEKKNYAGLLILASFIAFAIIISVVAAIQFSKIGEKANIINSEIQSVKLLTAKEEQKIASFTSANAVKELQTAVEWVEKLPVSSVFTLQHLTSLLPERGFILDLNYSDIGTVSLNVQFDTNRQAAYYLKALKDSEYVQNANLLSLTTATIDENSTTIVPRYVGSFQISLDNEKIRTIIEGGENE